MRYLSAQRHSQHNSDPQNAQSSSEYGSSATMTRIRVPISSEESITLDAVQTNVTTLEGTFDFGTVLMTNTQSADGSTNISAVESEGSTIQTKIATGRKSITETVVVTAPSTVFISFEATGSAGTSSVTTSSMGSPAGMVPFDGDPAVQIHSIPASPSAPQSLSVQPLPISIATILSSIASPNTLQSSSTQPPSATSDPIQIPSSSWIDTAAEPTSTADNLLYCTADHKCTNTENGNRNKDGTIAGIVVGIVAAVVLFILTYMLWRRRQKKKAHKFDERDRSPWHKVSSSDISTTPPYLGSSIDQPQHYSNEKVLLDFGKPGPVFPPRKMEAAHISRPARTPSYSRVFSRVSEWPNIALEGSNCSSDPFINDGHVQSSHSQIGLALTRYSTINSTAYQPSSTAKPASLSSDTIDTNIEEDPNRYSAFSAQSSNTTRFDDETVYIGKALTARRHSLTPRVINIVANGDSVDKHDFAYGQYGLGPSTQSGSRRRSIRSKSVSPTKPQSVGSECYFEAPNVSASFCNDPAPEETASVEGPRSNQSPPLERGRSMKRAADDYVGRSPTGHPRMKATIIDIKDNLRPQDSYASIGSNNLENATDLQKVPSTRVELPSSVTVARGSAWN